MIYYPNYQQIFVDFTYWWQFVKSLKFSQTIYDTYFRQRNLENFDAAAKSYISFYLNLF